MRRLIPFALVLFLCAQAQAGEIIVKFQENEFHKFLRTMGWISRVLNPGQKLTDKELIVAICNKRIGAVSTWKVKSLSEIPVTDLLVMRDQIIFQIPDQALRTRLDEAYSWSHVTQQPDEKSRLTQTANALLEVASQGIYENINQIPAGISVRFDDPKYERE